MFILRQNTIYLNEQSFNAWLIVLQLYLGYHAIFFKKINKYQLIYCILQYVHAGTWLTLVIKLKIFFKEKKTRVCEIYS